jgi:hypothetical protein
MLLIITFNSLFLNRVPKLHLDKRRQNTAARSHTTTKASTHSDVCICAVLQLLACEYSEGTSKSAYFVFALFSCGVNFRYVASSSWDGINDPPLPPQSGCRRKCSVPSSTSKRMRLTDLESRRLRAPKFVDAASGAHRRAVDWDRIHLRREILRGEERCFKLES